MNLFKLSWSYLRAKPLSLILSTVLVALGVSLTSFLLLLNTQFQDRLYKNVEGIDLVVSAKGSPLQMILSSVYHVDIPTGNVPLSKVKWLEKINIQGKRLTQAAIPLALGDSYEDYRIVGTTQEYSEHYNAQLAEGKWWEYDMETTIGQGVADALGLKKGDEFNGAHGLVGAGIHVHDAYAYRVVGIMQPTNTILDQLILTNVASVWRVHEEHEHEEEDDMPPAPATATHEQDEHPHDAHAHEHDEHEHDEQHAHDHDAHTQDEHDHAHHDHDHAHQTDLSQLPPVSPEGKEVTAYLVKYTQDEQGNVSTTAVQYIPQLIDEQEDFETLGYAVPAIQLQRLLETAGLGMGVMQNLAWIIIIISIFSVFISLYSSLKDHKYEIALMRVMGGSRARMFSLIVLEGVLIAALGLVLGLLISHLGMEILAGYLQETYKYNFTGWTLLPQEWWLMLGALGIGFVAALLPAIQAYQTRISSTLSEG